MKMGNILFTVKKLIVATIVNVGELLYPSINKNKFRSKANLWNCPAGKIHIYEHVEEWAGSIDFKFDTWHCGQYHFEPLKQLVWAAKYDNNRIAVSMCADILADEIIMKLAGGLTPISEWVILTTVPSTARSLRERAVDHMQEIATLIRPQLINFIFSTHEVDSVEGSSELLTISPTAKTSLVRQSETLDRSDRLRRAENKFQCSNKYVQNKSILLIDDVITTGATMGDCVRALYEAGATKVYCMSLAH